VGTNGWNAVRRMSIHVLAFGSLLWLHKSSRRLIENVHATFGVVAFPADRCDRLMFSRKLIFQACNDDYATLVSVGHTTKVALIMEEALQSIVA